ncbi:MAG: 50S ribosomal protein L9 [Dehalococcoidales bacterium]
MKVIFIQDVTNVGKAGEVKEVTNGYGRNYLIPKNLAVMAKADSLNTVGAKIKVNARHQAESVAELTELGEKLEGQEIVLEARSGGKERLYGSITTADIAEKLEETTGLAIDKRKIEVPESIRQIGEYEVAIRLSKDIVPKIKVTVTEKSS